MRWQIPAIMIFALLLTSGVLGEWNADNHDLQNTSATKESGPAPPLKFLWDPHKLGDIGWNWLTPIVHGNVAYLVQNFMYDFNITTVNITDGKILWIDNNTNMNVGRGCTYAYLHNNTLYFVSKWVMGAINATTGEKIWKIWIKYPYWEFSSNFLIDSNRLYVAEENTSLNGSSYFYLYCLNPYTGKTIWKKSYAHKYEWENSYLVGDKQRIYMYENMGILYAFNLTTGVEIWVKKFYFDGDMMSVIIGGDKIYIPFARVSGGKEYEGIMAINSQNGEVKWSKPTDSGNFIRFQFAYSSEYHMIVRVNETGNLIALDSRTGKVLWIANSTYDGISSCLEATPVIAKNYIYVYAQGVNLSSEYPNRVVCAILRLYNITTGKIVYQMRLPPVQGEESLNLPDIAVSNGKVFIPNMYFYVIVHGKEEAQEKNLNDVWYYVVPGAIAVVAVAVLVYIKKKN